VEVRAGAELEAPVAFELLLERLPEMRLATAPEKLAWRPSAGIALLSLGCSAIPALGCLLALTGPDRPLSGWRVASLVLLPLLLVPLWLLWSYES
jgi:hypothetical protein